MATKRIKSKKPKLTDAQLIRRLKKEANRADYHIEDLTRRLDWAKKEENKLPTIKALQMQVKRLADGLSFYDKSRPTLLLNAYYEDLDPHVPGGHQPFGTHADKVLSRERHISHEMRIEDN